jgi:hypothetical protein
MIYIASPHEGHIKPSVCFRRLGISFLLPEIINKINTGIRRFLNLVEKVAVGHSVPVRQCDRMLTISAFCLVIIFRIFHLISKLSKLHK